MKSNPLKLIVTDLLKKSESFVADKRFNAMVLRNRDK